MASKEKDFSEAEEKARKTSVSLREVSIRLITENWTAVQVTKLLAYIRDAIKSNQPAEIKVKVGKHVKDGTFSFTVNDQEISGLRCQPELEIN